MIDQNSRSCFLYGDVNIDLLKIDKIIHIPSFYDDLGSPAFIQTISIFTTVKHMRKIVMLLLIRFLFPSAET